MTNLEKLIAEQKDIQRKIWDTYCCQGHRQALFNRLHVVDAEILGLGE